MKKESASAEKHFRKGSADAKVGNYEGALSEYNKSLELNPELIKALTCRGNVKSLLGKHKEALADHDKALALNFKNEKLYNNRGTANFRAGNLKESLTDFNKAIELKPNYASAYINRAEVKLRLDDFDVAIADYSMVIKLKPKSSEAYQGRAIVKARVGDFEGSLQDLEKSFKLKPEDTWAGDVFPEEKAISDSQQAGDNRKKVFSYDEERDTDVRDYRGEVSNADYLNVIINMQLPTETYLRLRMLQRFNYKYPEAAKALGISLPTLWETSKRVMQKLKKLIPQK